jgi:integrase/recombinase XerD
VSILNSNEEFVIRAVGKISLEYPEIDQLKLRDLMYESLYKFQVMPEEQGLVTSDVEEKMMIFLASKRLEGKSEKTLYNYRLIIQ